MNIPEVGDIFECVLEDGSNGQRFNTPLGYDAIFRSLGGAIHFIQACNFPNPVIHRLIYFGGGYDFHIYDDKKSLLKKKYEQRKNH